MEDKAPNIPHQLGNDAFKAWRQFRPTLKGNVGEAQMNESLWDFYGNNFKCLYAHFNLILANSSLAAPYLPINNENIMQQMSDGVIFCAMAKLLDKNSIKDDSIYKGEELEEEQKKFNANLGLCSLQSLGVWPVSVPKNLFHRSGMCCALVYNFLEQFYMRELSITRNPKLTGLLKQSGNERDDLKSMTREKWLLFWANRQLNDTKFRIETIGDDLNDGVAYAALMEQIVPKEVGLHSLADIEAADKDNRLQLIADNIKKLGLDGTITMEHLTCGKLKTVGGRKDEMLLRIRQLFMAALFHRFPNLPEQSVDVVAIGADLMSDCYRGASEETLVSWLNSFGVTPQVTNVVEDLKNGLVLLQVIECIAPGTVNWSVVNLQQSRIKARVLYDQMINCNEVIEATKKLKLRAACDSEQFVKGDKKAILAFIFSLMLHHSHLRHQQMAKTRKVVSNDELLNWANELLTKYKSDLKLKSVTDINLKKTNLLGFIAERVLQEVGGKKSGYFKTVEVFTNTADNKMAYYSQSLFCVIKSLGIVVIVPQLNMTTPMEVCKDWLVQLHSVHTAKAKK